MSLHLQFTSKQRLASKAASLFPSLPATSDEGIKAATLEAKERFTRYGLHLLDCTFTLSVFELELLSYIL